jgi:LPXTG-motif cell wall-anchored protein
LAAELTTTTSVGTTSTTSVGATTTTLTPPPPGITFTFTNDASVETAEVGETIDYTYCGENTSDVPLEVVQVDDDRFGLLTVPEEQTIVEPGETLCSTDLGLPVTYVATSADAGTTIVNNAVVTVQTVGDEPQAFQSADLAEVEVLAPGQVASTTTTLPATALARTGASGLPTLLIFGALAVGGGGLLFVLGRRRNAN